MSGLSRSFLVVVAFALLHAWAAGQTAAVPPAPAASAASPPAFNKEQLEQLVAPIALYPDSLLSQVLMAATYPADVAEAAKWSKANKDMKGDAATQAVQNQPWDPSVMSLAAFRRCCRRWAISPTGCRTWATRSSRRRKTCSTRFNGCARRRSRPAT
jgi:hypothetical protein